MRSFSRSPEQQGPEREPTCHLPNVAFRSDGDTPLLFFLHQSAPAAVRSSTTALPLLDITARQSGVLPKASCGSTSAPASRNMETTSGFSSRAANANVSILSFLPKFWHPVSNSELSF